LYFNVSLVELVSSIIDTGKSIQNADKHEYKLPYHLI